MGLAVRHGLGDDGMPLWLEWSATSAKFDSATAHKTWRSFKPGPTKIGTLFGVAQQHGFKFEQRERDADYWERARKLRRDAREREKRERDDRQRQAKLAAKKAQQMVARAEPATHPYLEFKGLEEAQGLVLDGQLLVPMRHIETRAIRAVQVISPGGRKKYQPFGCAASACIYALGPRFARVTWWCEGYATALSIQDALRTMNRDNDQVIVTFASGQLARLARPRRGRLDLVVADHDWWHCKNGHRTDELHDACPECGERLEEPAGEKAARETGLHWWMPDAPGSDANDYYLEHGPRMLGRELVGLLRLAKAAEWPLRLAAAPG